MAFTANEDLTARDVEVAWRFALKCDPGEYDSREAFIANFAPDKYAKYVRICDVRDKSMARVHVSAVGRTPTVDDTD